MDALALLCNLHADGPLTLQRLRRAGCDSLDALFELEAPELGETLGTDARAAGRFLREAELLAERLQGSALPEPAASGDALAEVDSILELVSQAEEELDEDDLDEEDDDELAAEELEASDLEVVFDEDDETYDLDEEDEPEDLELLEPSEEADELDAAEVGRVLDAWRDLDRTVPPAELGSYELPRPEASPGAEVTLAAAALEGLGPELLGRLDELGVSTLGALAEAPPLDLAERVPLAYTRLRHLQFLARRERDRQAAAPAAAAEAPGPSLAPPFAPIRDRLDTAGPFA